jgi:putative copper resistance protein D
VTALVLCRFLHFAATMLLFGASAFVWALVPPELARVLMGPLRATIAAAIVVAAITALAWIALEAAQMGDGWADSVNPEALAAVLFDSAFGRVWLWRLGLAFVLLGALALGRHGHLAFIVPTAALLLASLGLVGHATMQAGLGLTGMLHRANHGVHLLSAGAWLGGLLPLLLCLMRREDARLRSEIDVALRRFSGAGHFVVALVVLTGVVNTALTLGAWPIDLSSPYQRLLAIKIAIVAAMIAMALFNRYVLAPRAGNNAVAALRALTINSAVEVALGAAALALVSIFGTLAPV